MNIALIAPPYPLSEAPSPPLGISYVAAACEKEGARVIILDYIVSQYREEKMKSALEAFQPQVIGITSVTMNFHEAAQIIKTAKRLFPAAITLMGGPHVSFDVENTLTAYPEIDILILGEAEITLSRLLPLLRSRTPLPSPAFESLKGIAFRKEDRIINNGPGEFCQDLDQLPMPARHLLPLSRYQALGFPISIITSRGCPNKCIFCLGRRMVGYKVRFRSPDRIADEIESLLAHGFSFINIADDLFTANVRRVEAFCDTILQRRLTFFWSAFSRVDTITKPMLEIMKAAGCTAVSFGIESGSPQILRTVQKRITHTHIRNAAKICKEVGMRAHASYIAGLPGETLQTLAESKALIKELDIEYGFHFLSPFPGTTLREEIADYDLTIETDDWRRYDARQPIAHTTALTGDQIKAFVDEMYAPILADWENLKTKYQEGRLAPDDAQKVESYHRLNFIFKLLSEDIIEKYADAISLKSDALTDLTQVCAQATQTEAKLTQKVLRQLVEAEYLCSATHDGKTTWAWRSLDNWLQVFIDQIEG